MRESSYLRWMAEKTPSMWCNDSALDQDLLAALEYGAVGCTSNPPLSYEALTVAQEIYKDGIDTVPKDLKGDDRVVALISLVVKRMAKILEPTYQKSGGRSGYIRSQVQPTLAADAQGMLTMGKTIASWGKNVMVKIPGTEAGIWVLEELAAMGIPTNPTVCTTVSQMVAAAEAHERGLARAAAKGIKAAPSTSAIVLGRLQDYLTVLNTERNAGLSFYDLESAALAVTKRCFAIFAEKGYRQGLMPAAFRSARQVEQLAGFPCVMTIHPKIQDEAIKADKEGTIARRPGAQEKIDGKALDRVRKALPEFERAYDPEALAPKDFQAYGATAMTLKAFDETGWRKIREL